MILYCREGKGEGELEMIVWFLDIENVDVIKWNKNVKEKRVWDEKYFIWGLL